MTIADLPPPSVLISGLTVGLSLANPRVGRLRITKTQAALTGLALILLTGSVTPDQAIGDLVLLSTPLATICCLMVVTLLADRAGVFRLLAVWIARQARGDGRWLFTLVFFTAAACGSVFTNDAAILIFTPLVYELVRSVDDRASSQAPFLFAVLYAANLAGALIVSNPVNMVIARLLDIGFAEYFAWMALPALASALVTYLGLRVAFASSIPSRVATDRAVGRLRPEDPEAAARMGVVVGLMLVGFFATELTGAPPWLAPAGAAIAALGLAAADRSLRPASVARSIPWSVLAFAVSMFLVAHGLRNDGLTDRLSELIRAAGGSNIGALTQVVALVTAGLSAVLNNHPSVDAMGWTIADMSAGMPLERTVLGLAAVIGGDLGPKMLPIGSLAALIWLKLLAERGVHVSTVRYVKLGVPITLSAVIVAAFVLSLEVSLVPWLGR